jgi:hypothetical protein
MDKSNKQIGFLIDSIKIEQFAIFEDNYNSKKITEQNTEIQVKLDEVNKIIGLFLCIEFINSKKVFIKIIVSCNFKIDDLSFIDFINESKSLVSIPKGFLIHLSTITTGTTRGVLFSKLEGTSFSKFILQTINLQEMIAENAVFAIT